MRSALYIALLVAIAPAVQAAPTISAKLAMNVPLPDPSGKVALRLTGHLGDRIGETRFGWSVGTGINVPVSAPTHVSPRLEAALSMKLVSFGGGNSLGAAVGWIVQLNPDFVGKGWSLATSPGIGPSVSIGKFTFGLMGTYGWTFASKGTTAGYSAVTAASYRF